MDKAILKLSEMYFRTEQMSRTADVIGARVQGNEERTKARNNPMRTNWNWKYWGNK